MGIDRRKLFIAMLGSFVASKAGAEARGQRRLYVSCRMDAALNASVAAFDADGREMFSAALPTRGHDTAVRPGGKEITVFARRPGNWFVVLEVGGGQVKAVVTAAQERHFYGHGVYGADGSVLYATENHIASGEGVIGVYDATENYRRIGEFRSGGIGPHDLTLIPDASTLVIANGGLRTHPNTGREALNPEDMSPNLALVDVRHGELIARQELSADLRKLSIRHLAVKKDRTIAFGCQYQGDEDDMPPLVGVWSPTGRVRFVETDEAMLARMQNYVGSVAYDESGEYLAATSPRGAMALIWKVSDGRLARGVSISDVCGVAASGAGEFLLSSGNAGIRKATVDLNRNASAAPVELGWIWDNHIDQLTPI
jgi:hypothetical protein